MQVEDNARYNIRIGAVSRGENFWGGFFIFTENIFS
jgi:hypothetical protein